MFFLAGVIFHVCCAEADLQQDETMALVHKAEALIRELTGNEAVFKRTKETGIVGGHNPIERGVTAGRPGEAVSAS